MSVPLIFGRDGHLFVSMQFREGLCILCGRPVIEHGGTAVGAGFFTTRQEHEEGSTMTQAVAGTKKSRALHEELRAMQKIGEVLAGLDHPARERVLTYIVGRIRHEAATAADEALQARMRFTPPPANP